MEGGPKFRKVRETPNGPHLERVRDNGGDPEARDLSRAERNDLRDKLGELGIPLNESLDRAEDGPESPSRRGFLVGAAATAVAASIPSRLGNGESAESSVVESEPAQAPESVEKQRSSEIFEAQVEGFEAFTKLHKDEVLYLDETGRPVGTTRLENFEGPLPPGVEPKEGQAPVYLYSIGEVDEIGLPVNNIPPRWLNQRQQELQADHPDRTITRRMNVVRDFQAAYNETDEPELVAKIANGEIDSYDEIVSYFLEKPVRGHEEYNRMEYTRKYIQFRSEPDVQRERPAVPETVQNGLRQMLPGLFAQESKFNAGLVSPVGAAGLAQIKPRTWSEYRGTTEVSLRMDDQLEVVGELMSDNYHYLLHYAGDSLDILRDQYESEEAFYEDLIVPLLINAYNVGGPGIGKLVKEFVDHTPTADLTTGKDLFIQFSDFSFESVSENGEAYSDDAREYVQRVYGNAAMLEEKYPAGE